MTNTDCLPNCSRSMQFYWVTGKIGYYSEMAGHPAKAAPWSFNRTEQFLSIQNSNLLNVVYTFAHLAGNCCWNILEYCLLFALRFVYFTTISPSFWVLNKNISCTPEYYINIYNTCPVLKYIHTYIHILGHFTSAVATKVSFNCYYHYIRDSGGAIVYPAVHLYSW